MESDIYSDTVGYARKQPFPRNSPIDLFLNEGTKVGAKLARRIGKIAAGYDKVSNLSVLLKNSGILRFRNGFEYPFDRSTKNIAMMLVDMSVKYGVEYSSENTDSMKWRVDSDESIIEVPQGIRFQLEGFHPMIFAETFLHHIHFPYYDVLGKTVVQAGGFVGDTALYYASLGARVFSFEPSTSNFELFEKNMGLNSELSQLVDAYNIAIGYDGMVPFPNHFGGNNSVNDQGQRTGCSMVESVSLTKALERFEIEDPFLLDLDIKGNEILVLKEESISEFEVVRVEYSTYGDKSKSTAQIVASMIRDHGFNRIQVLNHNFGKHSLDDHGTVVAMK